MDSDKVKLRKYEDDLDVCGFGVIILGAWGFLKAMMQIFMDTGDGSVFTLEMDFDTQKEKMAGIIILILIVALIVLFAFLIFFIHYYIGSNASKVAKGLPYKKGYYVWAIIILVLTVLGMGAYGDEIKDVDHIDTTIASMIVDMTTIYILGSVVYASRKVKKLREALSQNAEVR